MTAITIPMLPGPPDTDGHWIDHPEHRVFLAADAQAQLDFFRASVLDDGSVAVLDREGLPRRGAPQQIHTVARLVHSYALGEISGYPGAGGIVEAGLRAILMQHRDPTHGGYVSTMLGGDVIDGTKLAYGHAFVLLAGATATIAGHDDGRRLLDDVADIIDRWFWDREAGRMREEYAQDWEPISTYRGMNANMHTAEAMMAAFEATGDATWLDRAGEIFDFFVRQVASAHGWRIPEHYTEAWAIDTDYAGDPMFRPAGTTPGHSLEFGRLLLQHWDLCGRPPTDAPSIARRLIETAIADGWRADGGFIYTLHHGGAVDVANRYWWPMTEAICAVAALVKLDGHAEDEAWYRKLWNFAAAHFVDTRHGGWFPEIDEEERPIDRQFIGKPDIYHSLQADLFPLSPHLSRVADDLRDNSVSIFHGAVAEFTPKA